MWYCNSRAHVALFILSRRLVVGAVPGLPADWTSPVSLSMYDPTHFIIHPFSSDLPGSLSLLLSLRVCGFVASASLRYCRRSANSCSWVCCQTVLGSKLGGQSAIRNARETANPSAVGVQDRCSEFVFAPLTVFVWVPEAVLGVFGAFAEVVVVVEPKS